MNPRITGIVFLIAAALFAFVYFYEIRGGPAREQAEEEAKRLFAGLEDEAVEWIALTTRDGSEARVERREDGWELAEPLVFPADEFTVDGMASALAQLSSEAVLDDPQPPGVYGLDADEREVRFGAAGEKFALRTGDKTPVGGNAYASVGGSDAVYIVQSYRINALQKDLDDLRDKRILRFDASRSPAGRRAGGWRSPSRGAPTTRTSTPCSPTSRSSGPTASWTSPCPTRRPAWIRRRTRWSWWARPAARARSRCG
jgi:hypothetical protein